MSDPQEIPPAGQADPKTIIVVEDNDDIGELIRLVLEEDTSYHILIVSTPSEALRAASHTKANLFLIDYHLSHMDGLALCDHLRALSELHDVPVIIMSASLEQYEQELQERHLVGLAKPFDLAELLETVAKTVHEHL